MNYISAILISIFSLILTGCASGAFGEMGIRIENLERPLTEIQKAVTASLPLGQRKVQKNGMEFFSTYFTTKGRKFLPGDTAPTRYFAHVYVLGDRRPYSVEIFVKRQKRVSPQTGEYEDDGTDQELAKVVQKRIQMQLSKRREDVNMIDDFRIF